MVLFNTEHTKVYNYIIHHFLELEMFNEEVDIGDMIEILLPKYLYREQYLKCKKIYEELFYWTEDNFYHRMNAFHELALYSFITYMAELQEDLNEFDNIYFDDKCNELILEASKEDAEKSEDWSLEECKTFHYNVYDYIDCLFEETDFLLITDLMNSRQFGNTMMEEILGINIDFYFELLPLDIQEKYKTNHITLTGEISEMLEYIEDRTKFGSLYKLFWEKDSPVKEERIQLILENIMDAYFIKQNVDISREVLLGTGKVDFKLFRNENAEEKILIEIKRASSSYLKKGFETQLTSYMQSSGYANAFYLIACLTDEEYNKTVQFIKNHIYTDTIQMYINISILDLRKRKTASIS